MMGIARDLGGVPALTATAKYQLVASFVVLFIAAIIHNKQRAVLSEWMSTDRHRLGAGNVFGSTLVGPQKTEWL
jgi:hypothetical protein